MATSTQSPDVTIYAKAADPLTPVVVQYMNEHSGCNVTTTYISEAASDESEEGSGNGLKYPRIHVGNKYFGGVGCLDKFPLKVTEHRMKEITGEVDEPMCKEEKEFDRLILFNGKNEHEWDDMWKLYKQEIASYWVPEEMSLTDDVKDWENLKEGEKHFLKMVLAFFASLDVLVMENVGINFGQEIQIPQVQCHFAAQNAMESVHAEVYALLIQTYLKDKKERQHVLTSVQTMPIIQRKASWVMTYMDADTVSLAERLIGFICLEGIQFSGAFAAIYWFKQRGLMPGLCFANALIAKDEGKHAEASVIIYRKLESKLPETRVHDIFREAVDIEREFICEALPASLIGINAKEMGTYIEYVADFWLVRLGLGKLYNANNPFGFMEMIGLQGKSSFFEVRVSEYARANVLADEDQTEFALDVDF